MPHVIGRSFLNGLAEVWWDAGGRDRLLAWANKSDDNFYELTKLVVKMAPRQLGAEAEAQAAGAIEDALARIDAGEHARVVSPDDAPEAEAA